MPDPQGYTLFPVEQSVKTSDDYLTPKWLFDLLDITFDLDVAAPPWGTYVPATRKYTKADDGLTVEWKGRVWMNPPYSDPDPWVTRFIDHGWGVCLVPVSNGQWFYRLWDAVEGITLPGAKPIRFGGHDNGIAMRSMLAAFGDECVEAIGRLGRVR